MCRIDPKPSNIFKCLEEQPSLLHKMIIVIIRITLKRNTKGS